MELCEVRIRNFKGIADWKLEFRPGFNLIKGENGKGKTSVLEALAVGLGGFLSGIRNIPIRNYSHEDIRRRYVLSGGGSCICEYQLPVEVTITAKVDDEAQLSWTRSMANQSSRGATKPKDIARFAERTANQPDAVLPMIGCYGVSRAHPSSGAEKRVEFQNRTSGYFNALQGVMSNKLLLNWCVRMEQVGWQKNSKIAEYEAAKQATADFIRTMDQVSSCGVFYDKQVEELMVQQGKTLLPVTCLSAGYQSLIWMVFDIACRMALLNPFLLERITETPGVVLIDELDMHLHPKWQWLVIDALRTIFPNVQFIATTHAPILFSSAKDIWLIDMEGENIEYDISHYGLDIDTSVQQYQGNYNLPETVKKMVDSFSDAMDAENYESAKQMLDWLSTETAPESPLVASLRTRYDIETALREI